MEHHLSSKNIIELLQKGAGYLDSCGVDDARADADILLAHVLGTTRERLYLDRKRQISAAEEEKFTQLLQRRGNREPVAYILCRREFMGLDFYVDERVLIPRPETELLVEKTLEIGKVLSQGAETQKKQLKILDLCTGSGALAVSIAYYLKEASLTASDISAEALEVARMNAQNMQVEIDFRHGDLFEPLQGEKFDLIVSNPPYITEDEYTTCMEEVKKEPTLALLAGREGLDIYRRIALETEQYINPQGMVLLEIGYMQGPEVIKLFSSRGFTADVLKDYAGLDRIVIAVKE